MSGHSVEALRNSELTVCEYNGRLVSVTLKQFKRYNFIILYYLDACTAVHVGIRHGGQHDNCLLGLQISAITYTYNIYCIIMYTTDMKY